jgi:hypothetical protein
VDVTEKSTAKTSKETPMDTFTQHTGQGTDTKRTSGPDRRRLLRTGGAVVAGMAGLAIAETVSAGSASAAPGDPLILGSTTNSSSAAATSLTSASTTAATFAVANTQGLAPLKVVEQSFPAAAPALASGDLANYDGDLYYTAGGAGGPFFGVVYTEWTASQVIPIIPQRVLDTRGVSGRVNIVNPGGNLDSAGRLLAGHQIQIDLSELEVAAAAAYCNLTAVGPLAGGFMTLWPGGTRPATSSINFAANAVIANFAVTGVSAVDTVSIFSSVTTHVLLDISAFSVGDSSQVYQDVLPAPAQTSPNRRLAARAESGTLPHWYQRR